LLTKIDGEIVSDHLHGLGNLDPAGFCSAIGYFVPGVVS